MSFLKHAGVRRGTAAILATLVITHTLPTAFAQCIANETQRISPEPELLSRNLGYSVAISGDAAVIGAAASGDLPKAFVFRYDGGQWSVEAEFLRPVQRPQDPLQGNAVALDVNTLALGLRQDDWNGEFTGAIQIYRNDGVSWFQEARLTAADGEAADEFGFSLSISGDVLVTGARFDSYDGALRGGSAYVYRFDGAQWVQRQKLTPLDPSREKRFGYSVAVSGNAIAVGAYGDDKNSGATYIYRWTDPGGWVEEQKIIPSDVAVGDLFGRSVALEGDVLVVGSRYDDDNGDFSGSAYVFRHGADGWIEEAKLLADDGAVRDIFGNAVALSGDTIVVGAVLGDGAVADSGAAYVFRYDGSSWNQAAKLQSSGGGDHDWFAHSVAVDGETAIIGARLEGHSPGAAYVFGGLSDCDSDGTLDLCQVDQGLSEDCNGNGLPDECEPDDDCNLNGVADICDIAAGVGTDCNDNGTLDECDISSGTSEDCNQNGVPDECEFFYTRSSPRLGPIGSGFPQTHQFETPPPAIGTSVAITFDAHADLGGSSDFIRVRFNGVEFGNIFEGQRQVYCAPDRDVIVLLPDEFNELVDGGNFRVRMVPSRGVDPDLCNDPESYIQVTISYVRDPDCNLNGTLDECDIASGFSMDRNANGIPDECECDPCDANCDGQVNAFDIEPFLSLLFDPNPQPCDTCTGDTNGDGNIDAFDIEPFLNCLFP